MRISSCVFLQTGIDKQRAYFQIKQLLTCGIGPFRGNPLTKRDDMWLWYSGASLRRHTGYDKHQDESCCECLCGELHKRKTGTSVELIAMTAEHRKCSVSP